MEDIEDPEYVASEHDRLISAVSKFDKTQHITEPTRSEPSNAFSEFSLIKRSNKLDISNVAKVLEDTATHVKISKKLKKIQDGSKVLPKPLEKPQAERIKRATGYEETKKKVGRWDPVVARSRTANTVVYPIKHVETKLQPTNEFLSRFESKSELERQLEEVDPQPNIEEEEEEEEKIYPMSYEEMVEHRQQSAKMRAQQSYKEAKAKRQSKIKSKKYHRVLKKEKLKQQLKEFEDLQKSNPEEALKKLEAIEKARALERHTLRHKNTGKWAKNKMIRAKYDKDVRQQLAEQLAVSRSLTQKTKNIDSSDDDDADEELIPDISLSQDPMNPWMLRKSDGTNVSTEFDFGYKKYLKDRIKKQESESDTDDEPDESKVSSEINPLRETLSRITQNVIEEEINNDVSKETNDIKEQDNIDQDPVLISKVNDTQNNVDKKQKDKKITQVVKTRNNGSKANKLKVTKAIVATSNWVVEDAELDVTGKSKKVDIESAFESLENKVANKVEKKLKHLRHQIKRLENNSENKNKKKQNKAKKEDYDNLEYLKFKNQNPKAIIDEEMIETGHKNIEEPIKDDIQREVDILTAGLHEIGHDNIDPNRFIKVKPKYLNTALPDGDNHLDLLDDDEQVVPKVNIEEVFEEDDVVASFRQEKEEEINKNKSQDIVLTLPGWGRWGGLGVKPPKKRKNRFITRPAPVMLRRDENKGDIIIKEYIDPKLAVHKVKEIPYPFTSLKDYEASIRAPLGNTFIPERAHKKLIKPSVITKAGAIIEPMDEEELLVKKNRVFRNEKILKIVGKK